MDRGCILDCILVDHMNCHCDDSSSVLFDSFVGYFIFENRSGFYAFLMPWTTKVSVNISIFANSLQVLKFPIIYKGSGMSFPKQNRDICTIKIVTACLVE